MEKIKITCINNKNYPVSLEMNKQYEAIDNGFFYVIVDDNFDEYEYPKEIFVIN